LRWYDCAISISIATWEIGSACMKRMQGADDKEGEGVGGGGGGGGDGGCGWGLW
jgi:hypothetical protein